CLALVLGRVAAVLSGDGLREPLFGKALIDEQIADALLLRPHEQIALGDAVDVDARGGDQSERAKPSRVSNGDFGREPSAQRMADEMHLIEAERVDEVEIE